MATSVKNFCGSLSASSGADMFLADGSANAMLKKCLYYTHLPQAGVYWLNRTGVLYQNGTTDDGCSVAIGGIVFAQSFGEKNSEFPVFGVFPENQRREKSHCQVSSVLVRRLSCLAIRHCDIADCRQHFCFSNSSAREGPRGVPASGWSQPQGGPVLADTFEKFIP